MKSNTTRHHKMDTIETEIDRVHTHDKRLMDRAAARYYAKVQAEGARNCELKEGREFFLIDDNKISTQAAHQTPSSK